MKTTTLEKTKHTLLSRDSRSISENSWFLKRIASMLSELCEEWKSLGQEEFDLTVINSIERIPAEAFIRQIIISQLKATTVGSVKVPPHKLFEMMEKPDFGLFTQKYDEIRSTISAHRKNIMRMIGSPADGTKGAIMCDPNDDYFLRDGNKISINEEQFDNWINRMCLVHTENDKQTLVFEKLTSLADILNEIQSISPNHHAGSSAIALKDSPVLFLNEMTRRMLKIDENKKFVVNPEFVSNY